MEVVEYLRGVCRYWEDHSIVKKREGGIVVTASLSVMRWKVGAGIRIEKAERS